MNRPPMLLRCGVSSWQSMNRPPCCCIYLASTMSASFDALGTRENILSPMKHLPTQTPYSPPTRRGDSVSFSVFHTSTLAAYPASKSRVYASMMCSPSHAPFSFSRSAPQFFIVPLKSLQKVTFYSSFFIICFMECEICISSGKMTKRCIGHHHCMYGSPSSLHRSR